MEDGVLYGRENSVWKMEVQNIVQEATTKTIPKKNKWKKVKCLRNSYNSWEKKEKQKAKVKGKYTPNWMKSSREQ